MQHRKRWMFVVVLIIIALSLSACSTPKAEAISEEPAIVEALDGSEYNRVTLSAKAAERLDIQTESVLEELVDGTQWLVVPYAALLYGNNGETWVYVGSEALTYVRQPVTVEYIDGEKAFLVDGPALGSEVVTVGGAELYGADTGVGK